MDPFGGHAGLATLRKPPTNLRILEAHSPQLVVRLHLPSQPVRLQAGMQRLIGGAMLPLQPLDALYSTVDYAAELVPIFVLPPLLQALPGLLNRKPGAISIGLFRCAESKHFAKMSTDRKALPRECYRIQVVVPSGAKIFRERSFLDPSMNPSFFERFECSCLSMGESRFGAAFGEGPAFAVACLDQQELDSATTDPVANRGDLFAFTILAKF